jgi:hypothetical protein
MGVVWRAVDERLERSVAVKQILAQPGLSEAERDNMRQRAMREAKNAARLQHPNAIVVFDIAEHGGDPCLVMEYMPSKSLSAVLAEQPTLPLNRVARIGEQVASALVAAHRAGIVHRDIKPGNILIGETGTAKITDFGISRATGDLALTQTGLIGGTPAYLPPELARGADPAPASDVFSLGATLYHALEGQPPYGNSSNQLALLYTAANGQVIPPRQSGQATALLMSLLRSEPDERPTMSEARERLAALAAGEPIAPGGTRVSPALGHTGRQPAVTAIETPPAVPAVPAARPPWQRMDPQVPGQAPPRAPTAAFIAPRQPPPPPPAAPVNRRPAARTPTPDGRRKGILFGSLAAAVLLVAALVFVVLNSGGSGSSQDTNASATSSAGAPSSTAAPAGLGKTASASTVAWSSAGQRVIDFYDLPGGAAASWGMLTPAAQQVFGSEQEFRQYWSQYRSVSSRGASAYKRANNADGSVDIQVTVNYGDKSGQKVLRVVDSGGKLLIDSDPR